MKKSKKWIYINLYILLICLTKFIFKKGFSHYSPFTNGINIIPFTTIYEYITFFKHYPSKVWINGILSMFILIPLILWLNTKNETSISNNKNFRLFKEIFLISLNYSIVIRILNVGVFDIDSCILRAIFSFISIKFLEICMQNFKKLFRRSRI